MFKRSRNLEKSNKDVKFHFECDKIRCRFYRFTGSFQTIIPWFSPIEKPLYRSIYRIPLFRSRPAVRAISPPLHKYSQSHKWISTRRWSREVSMFNPKRAPRAFKGFRCSRRSRYFANEMLMRVLASSPNRQDRANVHE